MASPSSTAVGEAELIKFTDRLWEEGIMRRDETGLRDAEINLRFLRGQQHPQAEGPASPFRPDASTYRFTLNVMNQLVKRKTALITDSRPQIDIMAFSKNRRGTAAVFKQTIAALWDEANFDQSATRELVRAAVIGSTACVPMWNDKAKSGHGTIEFLMFDPRQVMIDPTVTRAIDVQRSAQFAGVKEVLSLNAIRENWPTNGPRVKGSLKWSSYASASTSRSRWQGIATAMQRPWRRAEELTQSASPRNEVMHTWFRDWPRDKMGQPVFTSPMFIRYVASSDGVVLKDEPMVPHHGQIPLHLLDWDIELEHPWGISEVGGLRRIQYTLNRIMAQVVENVLLTNRVKVVADADAVDQATWAAIANNPNGIFIRKRQGRTLNYDTPQNAVPNYIVGIIQLLLQGVDIVSGMTEVTRGVAPKGNTSGIAIEGLQIAAQSIIRLEARAFENWLERIFQQVLSLIWQYFTSDRLLYLVGPDKMYEEYLFDRAKLLVDDQQAKLPDDGWKDFTFKVLPGSSLAMTRVQKGVLASNLYQLGLIPGVEVLRAAEYPNPEEMVKQAREEAAMGLGPGAGGGKRRGGMTKFPNTSRRSVGM